MQIRLARPDELAVVFEIEMSSGALFATIGMTSPALDGPPDLDQIRDQIAAGRLWVAVDDPDHPVGFLAMTVVDDRAHLAQVSVDPTYSRRGIGRELIEHAVGWARGLGFTEMSLTTYAEVAWNAPYYERCGFRVLPADQWTPGLRAIRDAEITIGLDEWPRVCMTRAL